MAESDLGANWTAAYGLIRGTIASRVDLPSNTVHYYFHDYLGTTSIVTDDLGNIQDESDYYPYGGEFVFTNNDPNRYKFTGKERDSESKLDNFGARYYASTMGRFMTADNGSGQNPIDPQSWNLYAYVRNNPLSNTDPTGNACVRDEGSIGLGRWHDDGNAGETCAQVQAEFDRQREEANREERERDRNIRLNYGAWVQKLKLGIVLYAAVNAANAKWSADAAIGLLGSGLPCQVMCLVAGSPDAQRMTNKEATEAAKKLGYDREVKDPGFDSHGNKVFTNGKNYITADRDSHSGGTWKMFDSSGNRTGTYDASLNRIGD